MPLSMGKKTGAMFTAPKDQPQLGGEYSMREEHGRLYLGWYSREYFFSPMADGFELLEGNTVAYSFTRPV
ncbi:hypothetical protein [Puia dinghuensis]|nr:hypothetical protein [Puia dinghuensis]